MSSKRDKGRPRNAGDAPVKRQPLTLSAAARQARAIAMRPAVLDGQTWALEVLRARLVAAEHWSRDHHLGIGFGDAIAIIDARIKNLLPEE